MLLGAEVDAGSSFLEVVVEKERLELVLLEAGHDVGHHLSEALELGLAGELVFIGDVFEAFVSGFWL